MIDNITDLLLLVGTNPLPNYVVGKYLLNQCSNLEKLWLVYSEKRREIGQAGTGEFAENIKGVLKEEFAERELTFEMVALRDISTASRIKNDLEKRFNNAFKAVQQSKIHLNYTGGTKSMAVHVYRYLENNFKSSSSFSYLNGRNYKLLWDEGTRKSADLRKEIFLSLNSLIKLHGYEKAGEKQPLLQEHHPALGKFGELINADNLVEYLSWKNKHIRGKYYIGDRFIEKKQHFLERNNLLSSQNKDKPDPEKIRDFKKKFNEETEPLIHKLLQAFPREQSILDGDGSLWVPDTTVTNKIFRNRLKFTVSDFLDGKWLEHYVFTVIERGLQKDPDLSTSFSRGEISIDSNWEIRRSGLVKPFELDVIIVNGYQVCGISVTTSGAEGTCKLKGFEVIHRTGQIGGDEALSILVTCLEDKKKEFFSADLEQMTGATKQNLLVLSQSDLKPEVLWDKIKKYIWGEV